MANKEWIQGAVKKMKAKGTVGSFRAWCKGRGHSKVTSSCIAQGKKSSNSKIRKKANFAANVRKGAVGAKMVHTYCPSRNLMQQN